MIRAVTSFRSQSDIDETFRRGTRMTQEPLPEAIEQAIRSLASGNRDCHGPAYELLRKATEEEVRWADKAWNEMKPLLRSKDNRVRSIAGQVMCNLSCSASTSLVHRDLEELVSITHDERCVTARHVLQKLWKLGSSDADLRSMLLARLSERFDAAGGEKNGTLVRYDILCALRSLFDATGDESAKIVAMTLADTEQDTKYRKKYLGAWRGA